MSAGCSEGSAGPGAVRGAGDKVLNCPLDELAAIARDVLAGGNRLRFRARGFSMLPIIEDGDTVTVEPSAAGGPVRGDILLTTDAAGAVRVHRLLAVTRRGSQQRYITRGDNSGSADPPVNAAGILGIVRSVQKHNGGREVDLAGDAGLRRAGRALAGLQSLSWRLLVLRKDADGNGGKAGAVAAGLALRGLGLLSKAPRSYLRRRVGSA